MDCLLKKTLLDATNKRILPHIKISDQQEISLHLLPCCKATGTWIKKTSKNISTVCYCKLQHKFKEIQDLLEQHYKIWGKKNYYDAIPSPLFEYIWTWFIHYRHNKKICGYIITTTHEKPSFFWSISLMALWRIDVISINYSLGIHQIKDFIKMTQKFKNNSRPPVVFLEQKTPLWYVKNREELDYIINWCKSANAPLWISLYEHKNEKTTTPKSQSMKMFHKRIQRKKNEDPLKWLQTETLHSLTSVCKGYNQSLQKAFSNI